MSLLKRMLPIVISAIPLVGMAAVGFSDSAKDDQFLQNWVNTKKKLSVGDQKDSLYLGAETEVGFTWRKDHLKDSTDSISYTDATNQENQLSYGSRLMFGYKGAGSWMGFEVQTASTMDILNPQGALKFRKAIVGVDLVNDSTTRVVLELGKRPIYEAFESHLQFGSDISGAILKVGYDLEGLGKLFAKGAVTVLDLYNNHAGWIGSVGYDDIAQLGLGLHYNFTYWKKWHHADSETTVYNGYGAPAVAINSANLLGSLLDPAFATVKNNPQHRFAISEIHAHYGFDLNSLTGTTVATAPGAKAVAITTVALPANFFASWSMNHAAEDQAFNITATKGAATKDTAFAIKGGEYAYAVGLSLGELDKEGSWVVKAAAEAVGAQSIPSRDLAGIGRGIHADDIYFANGIAGTTLLGSDLSYTDTDSETIFTGIPYGQTNYYGFVIEAGFALTDDLVIKADFNHSRTKDQYLGNESTTALLGTDGNASTVKLANVMIPIQYNKANISFIYAF